MKIVIIFGSALTSRTPGDIDFTFKGVSLEEASREVLRWRDANTHRWDKIPEKLHHTPDMIEGDAIVIPIRPGQTLKTEIVLGEQLPVRSWVPNTDRELRAYKSIYSSQEIGDYPSRILRYSQTR